MRPRRRWHDALSLAAMAMLMGCGDTEVPPADTTAASGGVGSDTTVAVPDATFAGDTAPVEHQRPGSGMATLAAVRAAPRQAEPFERVVFEFAEQLPGHRVAYANGPVSECGSGRTVSVAGQATLLVRLEPAQAHAEREGEMQSTLTERDRRLDQPLVRQLTLTCDFEGQVAWAIGLAERRPFRVMELQHPPRLVVDVAAR